MRDKDLEMLIRIDERQRGLSKDMSGLKQRVTSIEKILKNSLGGWKLKVYTASLGLSLFATIGTTWVWMSMNAEKLIPKREVSHVKDSFVPGRDFTDSPESP